MNELEAQVAEWSRGVFPDQPLLAYLYYFLSLALRYAFISGVFFLLFYYLIRQVAMRWKIQSAFPSSAYIRHDVLWSLSTFTIVAGIYLFSIWLIREDYSQ